MKIIVIAATVTSLECAESFRREVVVDRYEQWKEAEKNNYVIIKSQYFAPNKDPKFKTMLQDYEWMKQAQESLKKSSYAYLQSKDEDKKKLVQVVKVWLGSLTINMARGHENVFSVYEENRTDALDLLYGMGKVHQECLDILRKRM